MREYCVYCDKPLTKCESDNLTEVERKYKFILCAKHIKHERANSVLLAYSEHRNDDFNRLEKQAIGDITS